MNWLKWIEYASPMRYSFEYYLRTEFEGVDVRPFPPDSLGFFFERWHIMLIELGYILAYTLIGLLILKLTASRLKN